MKVKSYKQVKLILIVILLILTGVSVWTRKVGLVFLGMLTYMFVVSLLKTRVKGLLVDERQVQVAEKAAQVSFQILLPMLALTSLAMMMGGGDTDFYYVRALGIVMSYVTCLGMLIYLLSYWYFDRESGGR